SPVVRARPHVLATHGRPASVLAPYPARTGRQAMPTRAPPVVRARSASPRPLRHWATTTAPDVQPKRRNHNANVWNIECGVYHLTVIPDRDRAELPAQPPNERGNYTQRRLA